MYIRNVSGGKVEPALVVRMLCLVELVDMMCL
jgi:hypothetical protein